MNSDLLLRRAELLHQMAALETMELGSLNPEFRTGPAGEKLGPYYKHQAWEEGSNHSRRVPAEEAAALELAIANRRKFEELATEFIELNVRLTRQRPTGTGQKKTTPRSPVVSSLKKRRSPS